MTVTLYDYICSELINQGKNEFVNEQGDLIFFEEESQFMTKVLMYDEDVSNLVDKLFTGVSLQQREQDLHFKKTFLARFANRHIGRQTIEAFRMQLLQTFLTNHRYLNSVYGELDKYIQGQTYNEQINAQKNQQKNDGSTLTDNRQAYANLPQNNVQLDLDSTTMDYANDNTISRNKQTNNQNSMTFTDGETSGSSYSFKLEELFKSKGIEEDIFNEFDRKCFKQTW